MHCRPYCDGRQGSLRGKVGGGRSWIGDGKGHDGENWALGVFVYAAKEWLR